MRTLLVLLIFLAPVIASSVAAADENYVFFMGGDRVSMRGSTDDVERARARLGKDPGRVLWVTRGGKDYVIRDHATLAVLDEPMKRMNELGDKQSILGRHQSTLGTRQSELGARQGKLGARIGAASLARTRASGARARELDGEIEGIQAEMEAIGQAQNELGEAQSKLGREQGRLGEEQGRVGQSMEMLITRIADQAIASGTAQRM